METRSLSNQFQHVLSERRKECSLRRLLRDRSGTMPIEVNNSDKSKCRSLRSTLTDNVIGKPGPELN